MSAAELRQAAETLRGLADDATSGIGPASMQSEWRANHDRYNGETTISSGEFQVGQVYCIQTGEYIATMHPGVGLALADTLTRAATLIEEADYRAAAISDEAMTHVTPKYPPIGLDLIYLARLINGGAS